MLYLITYLVLSDFTLLKSSQELNVSETTNIHDDCSVLGPQSLIVCYV